MFSQFQNRGRAYKCQHCGKIERKSRLVGHILKTHVPMDRVPFYCTLCSFRCEDRDTLLSHIKKYQRHREEEAKSGTPDYSQVLKRASNPIYVREGDMIMLSKEESLKWHARHMVNLEDPLGDQDGLFADDEETTVVNGLVMPHWMSPSRQVPTMNLAGGGRQGPNVGISTSLPVMPSFPNLMGSSEISQQQRSSDLVTIDPLDLANVLNRVSTPPGPSTVPQPMATVGQLSTPILGSRSPGSLISQGTPCRDERETENLLPGLLEVNNNDPLMRESLDVMHPSVISVQTQTSDPDLGEPARKKQRIEEQCQISAALKEIASATSEGF